MKREMKIVLWYEVSFMEMKLVYTVSNTSLENRAMKLPLTLALIHAMAGI